MLSSGNDSGMGTAVIVRLLLLLPSASVCVAVG